MVGLEKKNEDSSVLRLGRDGKGQPTVAEDWEEWFRNVTSDTTLSLQGMCSLSLWPRSALV